MKSNPFLSPHYQSQFEDTFNTFISQFGSGITNKQPWDALNEARQDRIRSEFAFHHGFHPSSVDDPTEDDITREVRNLDFFQTVYQPLLPDLKRESVPYMTFVKNEPDDADDWLDPEPLIGLSKIEAAKPPQKPVIAPPLPELEPLNRHGIDLNGERPMQSSQLRENVWESNPYLLVRPLHELENDPMINPGKRLEKNEELLPLRLDPSPGASKNFFEEVQKGIPVAQGEKQLWKPLANTPTLWNIPFGSPLKDSAIRSYSFSRPVNLPVHAFKMHYYFDAEKSPFVGFLLAGDGGKTNMEVFYNPFIRPVVKQIKDLYERRARGKFFALPLNFFRVNPKNPQAPFGFVVANGQFISDPGKTGEFKFAEPKGGTVTSPANQFMAKRAWIGLTFEGRLTYGVGASKEFSSRVRQFAYAAGGLGHLPGNINYNASGAEAANIFNIPSVKGQKLDGQLKRVTQRHMLVFLKTGKVISFGINKSPQKDALGLVKEFHRQIPGHQKNVSVYIFPDSGSTSSFAVKEYSEGHEYSSVPVWGIISEGGFK